MKSAFDRNLVIRKDLFKFEHFSAKLFLDMEIYSEPKYRLKCVVGLLVPLCSKYHERDKEVYKFSFEIFWKVKFPFESNSSKSHLKDIDRYVFP